MTTQVISTIAQAEAGTSLAADYIRKGELVAFPTETVYGLGANGLHEAAVQKIFEVKGRPDDNPLILHLSKKSEVRDLWDTVPRQAQPLMDNFWPGPLTLVFRRSARVPDAVTAGLPTVALRMPQNKTARALIAKAGVPIAAPSANLSGRPSPTKAEHVREDFDGLIPLILDGGLCRVGVESTVLSLVGKPTILRPGGITREMLEAVIGPVALAESVLAPLPDGQAALSPGMKHKHYAPAGRVRVVTGAPEKAAARILALARQAEVEGLSCHIAATTQTKARYRGWPHTLVGDRDRPETLCANLFALLRETEADLILAEGIPPADAGLAYMNRLLRAAGFDVEEV
ncbi:MAG: L-threonylcarbamoyladenylate synthase [Clostridiales bacterium]|nr:L-threonylcarbamoyladenylate synthase [Clostridiales bacterium]